MMIKLLIFAIGVLGVMTVALHYLVFSGVEERAGVIQLSAGLFFANLAIALSGWNLICTGEDMETSAGLSFLVLGCCFALGVLCVTPCGFLLNHYVPCLGYTVSLQAAFTLSFLALRAYFWLGTKGLLHK